MLNNPLTTFSLLLNIKVIKITAPSDTKFIFNKGSIGVNAFVNLWFHFMGNWKSHLKINNNHHRIITVTFCIMMHKA